MEVSVPEECTSYCIYFEIRGVEIASSGKNLEDYSKVLQTTSQSTMVMAVNAFALLFTILGR